MDDELKPQHPRVLPEKEFRLRPSIVTILSADKHLKSVYHLAVAAYVLVFLQAAIEDIHYGLGNQLGFRLIRLCFEKPLPAIIIWFVLLAIHFLVFVGWVLWTLPFDFGKNKDEEGKSYLASLWNTLWLCVAFVALFGTFHSLAWLLYEMEMPIGWRAVLLGEQTRFVMKGYAFLRHNTQEAFAGAKRPTVSQFWYFSFAPTLVYKHEYPRTETRDWTKVVLQIIFFFMSIHFLSLLEFKFFMRPFEDFGKSPFDYVDVIYNWVSYALPGFLCAVLLMQVSVLHSSQHVFAEILRFGDREFFKDWWTITDMSNFYTTWNVLIQDWLYTYVYKDFYEIVLPKNKAIARSAVFVLSIIMHEVLVIYVAHITFPICLSNILISLPLLKLRLKDRSYNLLMVLFFILGESALCVLCHLEYYAKTNCPNKTDAIFYVPRLFYCGY